MHESQPGFLVSLDCAPSFQAADLIKIVGIGGVAIGFAFQSILQKFLAGLLLLWSEPLVGISTPDFTRVLEPSLLWIHFTNHFAATPVSQVTSRN